MPNRVPIRRPARVGQTPPRGCHGRPPRIGLRGPPLLSRRDVAVVTVVLFTCAGQRVDIVRAFGDAGATTLAVDARPARAGPLPRRPPGDRPADRRPRLRPRARGARRRARRPPHRPADRPRPLGARARPGRARARARAPPGGRRLRPHVRQARGAPVLRRAGHRLAAQLGARGGPRDARYPLLVKARQGFGSNHIFRADDPEQLDFFLRYTTVAVVRAGALPRRGVLDRRLLRHGRRGA